MFDLAAERKSRGSRRVFTRRSSTSATSAVRDSDSLPAFDSMTALRDAVARTESTDPAHKNTDASDDRAE